MDIQFQSYNYSSNLQIIDVFMRDEFYHVKLSHRRYPMIYRAARGVYWDEETSSLYYKGVISYQNALKNISEAMNDEHGIILEL